MGGFYWQVGRGPGGEPLVVARDGVDHLDEVRHEMWHTLINLIDRVLAHHGVGPAVDVSGADFEESLNVGK